MSRSEILVKVSSVSKKFCRDLKTSLKYGLYDIAAELNPFNKDRPHAHDLREGEFWAVKDVSFELKRGECLGLIGHNGAGKTTLLKMLNGLIKPDTGRIEMNGRVGALIALGAGFNPILTGRENIYVNGSILGLSKREIDDKLDEIIDFAEIRDAIDAPVQSYSSGMQVRLGFAIATALQPDVLLLDEVLAVGDARFRAKCYNTISKLIQSCAVIFVSHSMTQVARLCGSSMLLDHGRVFSGPTDSNKAIELYFSKSASATAKPIQEPGIIVSEITVNGSTEDGVKVAHGAPLHVIFDYVIPPVHPTLEISVSCLTPAMELTTHTNSSTEGLTISNDGSPSHCHITIDPFLLGSGTRKICLMIRNKDSNEILFWAFPLRNVVVTHGSYIPAPAYLRGAFTVTPITPGGSTA